MTDKNKKNTYMGNFGKEIELTKEEYVKRWNEVARDCSRLISWRDMKYTTTSLNYIRPRMDNFHNICGFSLMLKKMDGERIVIENLEPWASIT